MNEEGYKGIEQLAYSVISTQVACELLKKVTQEKRPNYEIGNTKDSFPSGHAAGAFSGAMFIHRRYGFKKSIVLYCLAIYTGYSRVIAKRHYIHDVLGGAVIAGICTYIFVDKKNKFSISVNSDEIKLNFEKHF